MIGRADVDPPNPVSVHLPTDSQHHHAVRRHGDDVFWSLRVDVRMRPQITYRGVARIDLEIGPADRHGRRRGTAIERRHGARSSRERPRPDLLLAVRRSPGARSLLSVGVLIYR